MSHYKPSDCLAGQILLPLAIRFDECPLRRALDQASTTGKNRTNSSQTIGRRERPEAGRLLGRNIGINRKAKVADVHGSPEQ
jgi:hypothetical protein